jgi:autotransporter-associated beta strand protein
MIPNYNLSKRHIILAFLLLFAASGIAQTSVAYSMNNIGAYSIASTGSSGVFTNGSQLGMYSNGGGTKNVVCFRDFKTGGNNTGSQRALQVGDVFTLTVNATSAYGHIGFSLNAGNVTGSYANRNTNSRLYIQEDGTTGSWYVNSSAGNQSLEYNTNATRRDYVFKIYITSEKTFDVELTVDGTTKRLFNRTMNGTAGANITGFSLYLTDDYNGFINGNVFWKQVTEVRASSTVNLGQYLESATFTPGRITDGLTANSTDIETVNAVNIGGDILEPGGIETKVILNQPNTYTGPTTINYLAKAELQHAQGFGQTSGVTVAEFGELSLYSPGALTFERYPLAINGYYGLHSVGGTITWPGAISVPTSSIITADTNPGSLTLSGEITIPANKTLTIDGTQPIFMTNRLLGGGKIIKKGTNVLTLSENNSALTGGIDIGTGTVSVTAGPYRLGQGVITFPTSDGYMGTLSADDFAYIENPIAVISDSAIIKTLGTVSCFGTISGGGALTKTGFGELVIRNNNSFSGGCNLAEGSVRTFQSNSLGSGMVKLGYNYSGEVGNSVTLHLGNSPLANDITVAQNISGASRIISGDNGLLRITGSVNLYGSLSVNGDALFDFYGDIMGSGGLNINSRVEFRNYNNDYFGDTTINSGGSLRLTNSNVYPNYSRLVLNGGVFQTTYLNEQLYTLKVQSDSSIELGFNPHTTTFSSSIQETWNGILTIKNWFGTAGQSNVGQGRIFVGVGGLTTSQLNRVVFEGYPGRAIILPSGELVPAGPPNLQFTAGNPNFYVCVNSPSTITYTIKNFGGVAGGVTVVSNSPNFVVGNLSATSIGTDESVTFNVTFTPSVPGTTNANITVNTTTPNSNAPVNLELTGFGLALPTATISGTTTACINSAQPSITFTGANSSSPYTFKYKINGGADVTVTTVSGNSVNVPVPTAIAGSYVYSLVSVTSAAGCLNLQSGTSTVTVDPGTVYYADTDNDGFGSGVAIVSCTGQPANTATNNTDCAPTNSQAWQNGNFYVDADNDGYYNGSPTTSTICYGSMTPSGYTASIIGTDCDDANANANPNHVEIAGNTIDDNCDGTADEAGPVIGMIPSQCGTTMSNIAATIYSQQASGAEGYRFEVTNGANVRTYDSATNSFSLVNLPGGVLYATTYSIRVAVKTAGFYRSYSGSCNITTPSAPATTVVIASQCGTTLANIANLIYCNQVTAANQYRFEVTDGVNPARTFDTSVNRFSLTNLAGGATYGVTYSVRVALRFGATWEPYGTACNITTPATPGVTSLIASQCGITISNRWVSLYANQVPDAQGYRFEVSDGVTTRFVDRAVSNFALGQVAGGVSANTVYTVRVAVLYNSVYGAFGAPCTVTTSAGFSRQAAAPVTVFEVKTYPNPFAATFKLDINTSSEALVSVKVYDMIGKLVESHEINATELGTQELGNRYSSGVYNVIVSQGENVETLRVIKR